MAKYGVATEIGSEGILTKFERKTLIVHDRYGGNASRLDASRRNCHGLQVMTFEQAACKLASGLIEPIDRENLNRAIKEVLPSIQLDELGCIKGYPGMVKAASNSLTKLWHSGLDIGKCIENGNSTAKSRLKDIQKLEQVLLEKLPPRMLRPVDIVEHARENISHAQKILGPMEISGLTDLEPCWRLLLFELSGHIEVVWNAGPRENPEWLKEAIATGKAKIEIVCSDREKPEEVVVSTANPYHEAVEAIRWARSLIASGKAKPGEIAIASASTSRFDDYFQGLCSDKSYQKFGFEEISRPFSSGDGSQSSNTDENLQSSSADESLQSSSADEGLQPANSGEISQPSKSDESSQSLNSDENFGTHSSNSGFQMHFVEGVSAMATRDGQKAAALANMFVRGISKNRLIRFYFACRKTKVFNKFPDGWLGLLPKNAPMTDAEAWIRFFEEIEKKEWSDYDHLWKLKKEGFKQFKQHCLPELRKIVDVLVKEPKSADEVGKALLQGVALKYWKEAQLKGNDAAIDNSLSEIKVSDGIVASTNVIWISASELACTPRRFVRLIGLNSSHWPRNRSEDSLIPDHVIPIDEFDPIPLNHADKVDYESILAATSDQIVLSFARRGEDRRKLGKSQFLNDRIDCTELLSTEIPLHAYSESDRLMARLDEFRDLPLAISANECWDNWRKSKITKHDGLVEEENLSLLSGILERVHSATSLRLMLRNPIGYFWRYGLRWSEPERFYDPLKLDNISFGDLVHEVLDRALLEIEKTVGMVSANETEIESTVDLKLKEVACEWEHKNVIPPRIVWNRKLVDARNMAVRALKFQKFHIPDADCYGEVPFGRNPDDSAPDEELPWDADQRVKIPGTDIFIYGVIDRLDLSKDKKEVLVQDYKTGNVPSKTKIDNNEIVLKGGEELQRCLYSLAVRSLLGNDVNVKAFLLYLKNLSDLPLESSDEVLTKLADYVAKAKSSLAEGNAIPGIDAGTYKDRFALALPAGAVHNYLERKKEQRDAKLSSFAGIWEEK